MNNIFSSTNFSRSMPLFMSLFLAALLTACGGGGDGAGKVGLPTGVALYTNAPGTVTLAAPAQSTFTIGGGTPTYSAASSNKDIATASVSGTSLTVVGVGAGSATVTVTDAVGAAVNVAITISAPPQPPGVAPATLFTTAAGTLTVGLGASSTYTVGGGVPAYAISSSNTAVATATLSGTSFSVTGVGAGSAQVVITDAAGTALGVAVTVGAAAAPGPLFTTAPSDITLAVDAAITFAMGGGQPPYSATSGNAGVARVATNGSAILITGISQGATQVALVDGAGDKITLAVTVGTVVTPTTPTPLFTTAPTEIAVAIDAGATFAMGGGQAPYSASSSNAAVAKVATNGSAVVITGVSQGAAQIVLGDGAGAKVTVAVTVGNATGPATTPLFTTAPGEITVAVDASANFSMGGGQAPYSASSSNVAVAKVATNGNAIVITGVGQGAAQIVLADSAGANITVGVTVGTATTVAPLFTTAPEALALTVDEVGNYTIGGGKPAYSISTSNASVAKVAVNGTAFSITAMAAGGAKVTVTDTIGNTGVVDVTVTSTTPPPPTPSDLTVSPGAATGNVGDTLTFLVSGGTPAYTLFINNTSIASIESVGSGNVTAFTVRLNNVGDTSATITDATGKILALPITVNQTSTSLRLSPNALLVGENSTGALALNIYGGTGPYRAFTSDETLSSVSVTGSVLTVGLGSNTNRCINPITSDGTYIPTGTFDVTVTTLDSLGASATSIVTIKDNGQGLDAGCPTPP